MSEKLVEKIIGAAYVVHNDNFFVADVYEGNYYKIQEGNTVKMFAFPKKEYERVLAQYEECVKNDTMISSAYEMNKRANHSFEIPAITADPEAAEKEWYIRKHPQVVPVAEPIKKKRRLFGKKEKQGIGIKCLNCGTVHKEGQKFCSECGEKLPTAQDEIVAGAPLKDAASNEKADVAEKVSAKPQEVDFMESESADQEDLSKEAPEGERAERAASKKPYVKPTIEQRDDIILEDVDEWEEEPADKPIRKKTKTGVQGEKSARRSKKRKKKTGIIVFTVFLAVALMFGIGTAVYLYLGVGGQGVIYNSENEVSSAIETVDQTTVQEQTEPVNNGYIVIKLKNDVAMNEQIMEDDLEGTILSEEQFAKYNRISTYIDKNGETKEEILLFWEDRAEVIGKYASRDIESGSILYDTSITSEHVIADKTFVEVEVDGENKTYEATTETLPGNTRIQIVAIVKTDGADPQQVLLSEMTLQDRSLESIFDSAGQDILDMLSNKSQGTEEDSGETQNDVAEETVEAAEEDANE